MGSKYIIDYAEKLKNGELKEIVGRKKEIRRVMHILLRDMKSNPMLLGQTGVGQDLYCYRCGGGFGGGGLSSEAQRQNRCRR